MALKLERRIKKCPRGAAVRLMGMRNIGRPSLQFKVLTSRTETSDMPERINIFPCPNH